MSASRKVQTEMNRTFKKVAEGVDSFEEIYEKVYSASEQSLKEKYAGDLKKEVKKLQRCRDSIKSWLSNNSIKDKSKLQTAKRTIETKMELFKECEKHVKTKQFSKEGLAQATELDPKEKEKNASCNWINQNIEEINNQAEDIEAELETLNSKKRPDRDKVAELEERLKTHKWHTEKMETMLRLIMNDALEPEEADAVRDDIEYYVESNMEDEFYPDEELYDELDLDNRAHLKKSKSKSSAASRAQQEKAEAEAAEKAAAAAAAEREKERVKKARLLQETREKEKQERRRKAELLKQQNLERMEREKRIADLAKKKEAQQAGKSSGVSMANLLRGKSGQQPTPQQQQQMLHQQQQQQQQRQMQMQQGNQQQRQQMEMNEHQQQQLTYQQLLLLQQRGGLNPTQQRTLQHMQMSLQAQQMEMQKQMQMQQQQKQHQKQLQQRQQLNQQQQQHMGQGANRTLSSSRAPAIKGLGLGIAPRALDTSLAFLPRPGDSECKKEYRPSNPAPAGQISVHFPTTPAPVFTSPTIFENVDTDVLFFIFYHRQGTYQQYLAARELKRQSWRFHKKYMTWFQRHEEPQVTTEEYEQGTYVYFDYETGWYQRIKSEFTFEYSYLEDELVV